MDWQASSTLLARLVVHRLGVSRTLVDNAKYRVARRLGELARGYEDV